MNIRSLQDPSAVSGCKRQPPLCPPLVPICPHCAPTPSPPVTDIILDLYSNTEYYRVSPEGQNIQYHKKILFKYKSTAFIFKKEKKYFFLWLSTICNKY